MDAVKAGGGRLCAAATDAEGWVGESWGGQRSADRQSAALNDHTTGTRLPRWCGGERKAEEYRGRCERCKTRAAGELAQVCKALKRLTPRRQRAAPSTLLFVQYIHLLRGRTSRSSVASVSGSGNVVSGARRSVCVRTVHADRLLVQPACPGGENRLMKHAAPLPRIADSFRPLTRPRSRPLLSRLFSLD